MISQEIACLKRQFAELLSDIGFVKDGLKARVIEKLSSKGSDGVLEATGYEVPCIHIYIYKLLMVLTRTQGHCCFLNKLFFSPKGKPEL